MTATWRATLVFACCVLSGLVSNATAADPSDVPLGNVPLDGPRAVAAVPWLRGELLSVQTPSARRQRVALLLARMGDEAVDVVPDLGRLARDDVEFRRTALKALSIFGPLAVSEYDTLTRFASDDTETLDVRLVAAEAVARTATIRPDAAIWFHTRLRDPALSKNERAALIGVARFLEPVGSILGPTLVRALEHDSEAVRRAAVETLGAVGTADAVGPLGGIVLGSAPPLSGAAVTSLQQIGPAAHDVLAQLAVSDDAAIRERVVRGWTRPSAARTETLLKRLDDEQRMIRFLAAKALLDTRPTPAIQTLRSLQTGDDRTAKLAQRVLRLRAP